MGLDMYAGIAAKKEKEKEYHWDVRFTWRKHAKLQQYMMMLWHKKENLRLLEEAEQGQVILEHDGLFSMGEQGFNAGDILELTEEDILELKQLVMHDKLPTAPSGFFWGLEFQDESAKDYMERDLDFCEWALDMFAQAKKNNEDIKIFYESSW